MNVGIICFWDRYATPYLDKYERALRKAGLPYDIIFWRRSEAERKQPAGSPHELVIDVDASGGPLKKIPSFLRWRRAVLRLLQAKRYGRLIVLTTYPAILLHRTLCGQYRGRFVFDIRDYSMEANPLFRLLVMRLVGASCFTAVSSRGFLRFLGKSEKLTPNHNLTADLAPRDKHFRFAEKGSLTFTFVGNVRLDRQTAALLLTLANSPRYFMRFVGRVLPGCPLEALCAAHQIRNVSMEGPFNVEDKEAIYAGTDLINAVYANGRKRQRLADSTPLPNRLYDALVFRCPIVASTGTYLAELVERYHLGFSLNGFDRHAEARFDSYAAHFDETEFLTGCDKLLAEVLTEEAAFLARLHNTLTEWRERDDAGKLQRN